MTLEINKTVHGKEDAALYLEEVAKKIREGFWSGQGWDMEGEENHEEM